MLPKTYKVFVYSLLKRQKKCLNNEIWALLLCYVNCIESVCVTFWKTGTTFVNFRSQWFDYVFSIIILHLFWIFLRKKNIFCCMFYYSASLHITCFDFVFKKEKKNFLLFSIVIYHMFWICFIHFCVCTFVSIFFLLSLSITYLKIL